MWRKVILAYILVMSNAKILGEFKKILSMIAWKELGYRLGARVRNSRIIIDIQMFVGSR